MTPRPTRRKIQDVFPTLGHTRGWNACNTAYEEWLGSEEFRRELIKRIESTAAARDHGINYKDTLILVAAIIALLTEEKK